MVVNVGKGENDFLVFIFYLYLTISPQSKCNDKERKNCFSFFLLIMVISRQSIH